MTKPIKSINREHWLDNAAQLMCEELFNRDAPNYQVTCGFPSKGAAGTKRRTLGECFDLSSQDRAAEIVVSMVLDKRIDVLQVLAHELCHAYLGHEAGHGPEFRKLALSIGLAGKMTATIAGPEFIKFVWRNRRKLGLYPHKQITLSGPKQSTRMIKAVCPDCGYTVRLSRKWADKGLPLCNNWDEHKFHAGIDGDEPVQMVAG